MIGTLLLAGCGDEEEEPTTTAAPTTTTQTTTTQTATTANGDEVGEADGRGEETAVGRPVTIENTLEAVFTGSGDAALICDVLVTDNYVRTAYGAREGCIAAQEPGALADSVRIEGIYRSVAAATAIAIPTGGPYDGVEVEVELVREPGGWRVDSLLADVPAGP